MMLTSSQPYSIFPFKSSFAEKTSWILQSLDISILLFSMSMITTFSGCLSYYAEGYLRELGSQLVYKGDELKLNINTKNFEEIFKSYTNLYLALRELNKKIGLGLFIYYSTYAVSQAAQTYCIFSMIRSGYSIWDLLFMLLDIFVKKYI